MGLRCSQLEADIMMTVNVPTGGDTPDPLLRGVFLFVHLPRLPNWLTKAIGSPISKLAVRQTIVMKLLQAVCLPDFLS